MGPVSVLKFRDLTRAEQNLLLLKSSFKSGPKLRPPRPVEAVCHHFDDEDVVLGSLAAALKQAAGRSTRKCRQSAKLIYKRVVDFVELALVEEPTVIVCQRQKDFDQDQYRLHLGKFASRHDEHGW